MMEYNNTRQEVEGVGKGLRELVTADEKDRQVTLNTNLCLTLSSSGEVRLWGSEEVVYGKSVEARAPSTSPDRKTGRKSPFCW